MDRQGINREPLSARQLAVGVMVGGLSWVGGLAGHMDWRWALAVLPLGLLLGWGLLCRMRGRRLYGGRCGWVLAAAYGLWGTVLLAVTLRRAAGRIIHTGGSQASVGWILVLLALPMLWVGLGKGAAFFRLAELLWLVMAVLLAALVLLMAPRVEGEYLFSASRGPAGSLLAMGQVLSTGLFALPHLYRIRKEPGDMSRGLSWLAGLGVAAAALSALTAGLLSQPLADQLKAPFYTAVGILGKSARLEGLISALWLLPDLVLAGLVARSWGEKPRPAIATGVALALALTGWTDRLGAVALAVGGAVLVILTLLWPGEKGK